MKRIISVSTKLIGNTSFRVEHVLMKEEGKTVVHRIPSYKDVAPNPFKKVEDLDGDDKRAKSN